MQSKIINILAIIVMIACDIALILHTFDCFELSRLGYAVCLFGVFVNIAIMKINND